MHIQTHYNVHGLYSSISWLLMKILSAIFMGRDHDNSIMVIDSTDLFSSCELKCLLGTLSFCVRVLVFHQCRKILTDLIPIPSVKVYRHRYQ